MAVNRSRKQSPTTKTSLLDLPDEVLISILTILHDHYDIVYLSLVSKSFCSFINPFVDHLTFNNIPSNSAFRKLFTRFSSVTRIAINSTRIDRTLTAIANSVLKIESLEIGGKPSFPKLNQIVTSSEMFRDLRMLKIQWFSDDEEDLSVSEFVGLFPSLEVLDLSDGFSWSDAGIRNLLPVVPNLLKIRLDYNNELTDSSLEVLSTCCVNLKHLHLECCYRITYKGICNFMRKSQKLKVLVLPSKLFSNVQEEGYSTLLKSISLCGNLRSLRIKRRARRREDSGYNLLMATLKSKFPFLQL